MTSPTELARVSHLTMEAALLQQILRRVRAGSASPSMIEEAIRMAGRQMDYAAEIKDQRWRAASLHLKTELENGLRFGLEKLRAPALTPPEKLLVENPLVEALESAHHKIRRQFRCLGGIVDVYDLTADEIIECKLRGNNSGLADAAAQLQRYKQSFPGSRLAIAVLTIEVEADWLATLLRGAGIRIIEIERGDFLR